MTSMAVQEQIHEFINNEVIPEPRRHYFFQWYPGLELMLPSLTPSSSSKATGHQQRKHASASSHMK
jgi:hypothetical protein